MNRPDYPADHPVTQAWLLFQGPTPYVENGTFNAPLPTRRIDYVARARALKAARPKPWNRLRENIYEMTFRELYEKDREIEETGEICETFGLFRFCVLCLKQSDEKIAREMGCTAFEIQEVRAYLMCLQGPLHLWATEADLVAVLQAHGVEAAEAVRRAHEVVTRTE